MKRLTPEQQAESRQPDIALGFTLFLRGLEQDNMLDFWRRFENNRALTDCLQKRIDIKQELQMNPDIERVAINFQH